jgi:hypothetical protein
MPDILESNDESKFWNEIRDHWTGREYHFEGTLSLIRVIKIVEDDGHRLSYNIGWISKATKSEISNISVVAEKENLKRYISEVGYFRVK